MTQPNYDPSTFLHWFRKLDQHPEDSTAALAEAFCRHVASRLDMPPPRIFWFEEADYRVAGAAGLNQPSRRRQEEDPLGEPCAYFRWRGQPKTVFLGYTHHETPRGIMINI